MNLREPDGGSARVLGRESRRLGPADLARIGYVSEGQQLPEHLTIAELEGYCRPFFSTWDDSFAAELRSRFDLDPARRIRTLSRGMRLKAAFLVALAPRPSLLVLDEPFSGLDPVVRDDLVTGLLSLADKDGWSVLLTSHEMDDIERLADHVGFLEHGRLAIEEPIQSLLDRFVRVDVDVPDGAAIPAQPPASWLGFTVEGRAVRFAESRMSPAADAEWRAAFPGAHIDSVRMSLRDVFVALARASRQPAGGAR
jgi:ABC-2 type transport system ATP-binding protein